MNHPNPKQHQTISFIKSGVRILGYVGLMINPPLAIALLVVSEAIHLRLYIRWILIAVRVLSHQRALKSL